jgi:pimeloyl-ACP methyl ester carboxylesterase
VADPDLDPRRFTVRRAEVRAGVELAYVREGAGAPLLLVHGWPETMRIWWRVIAPLAGAGFEVIAPDLRGFGASGLAPDGAYDPAAHARDLHALVHDHLGHVRCFACGGDLGGVVIQDLGRRFEGFVARQVLFNTIVPRPEGVGLPTVARMAADYFRRQGRQADALAAELDTPAKRTRYVGEFYGHRFWATPGAFDRAATAFQAEPFADAKHLRASFGNYESALGERPLSEPPRSFEGSPIPTLVLYGPDDHVIPPDFPELAEAAFADLTGPFVVPRAGHFLQWERAGLLAKTLAAFCR